MKRNRVIGLLLFAIILLLTGCSKKTVTDTTEKGYKIYYVTMEGTRLMESSYEPQAQTFEEMMDELLGQLATPPVGYDTTLKHGVHVEGYERGIDALRIDFSPEYYDLSNTEEVLLRAAVVKTVSQIPAVSKVMITVNQEQLKDLEGNVVPAMDANSFIDTKEGGINSYLYATITLYFGDPTGTQLAEESRTIHYSSNMVLERLVVEQLIAGPDQTELKPLFNTNVRIQNLYIQDGICTINFEESANRAPADTNVTPELVIQAIVDSICRTCDGITGVKFEINGDRDIMFRDRIKLDQIFEPSFKEELIQTEKAEMQTETEIQEVSETELRNPVPEHNDQQDASFEDYQEEKSPEEYQNEYSSDSSNEYQDEYYEQGNYEEYYEDGQSAEAGDV